jgi:uncharacterized membrane protein
MPATVSATPDLYPVPLEPRRPRLESLDMLRGLLMILMALDHTRDYFSSLGVDPTNPHESWPLLFVTRWVTHLCAPGFIALAGASVYLQGLRGKSKAELRHLLITRGLWLIFLEWTLIDFGWSFTFAPFLQVIWAVGFAMIGLGLLIELPVWAIGGIGAAIVCLHNLLDPIKAGKLGNYQDLWMILHQPGMLMAGNRPVAFELYPLLPWFGVICLGYWFGQVAAKAPQARRRIALQLATAFAIAFTLLRVFHGYGDGFRFEVLDTPARTAMSFLQVSKYPPSLQYCLATFTVLLVLYATFDLAVSRNWAAVLRRVLETYGRVPFFFYVLHIYLLHGAALLGTMAEHGNWREWMGSSSAFLTGNYPAGWGFSLGVVYLVWIAAVALLYLPCVWFSGVKARRRDWWLSYL